MHLTRLAVWPYPAIPPWANMLSEIQTTQQCCPVRALQWFFYRPVVKVRILSFQGQGQGMS